MFKVNNKKHQNDVMTIFLTILKLQTSGDLQYHETQTQRFKNTQMLDSHSLSLQVDLRWSKHLIFVTSYRDKKT